MIGLLEPGETWVYLATGTWAAGQNTNTGTASGSFTDDAPNVGSDNATDDAKLVADEVIGANDDDALADKVDELVEEFRRSR